MYLRFRGMNGRSSDTANRSLLTKADIKTRGRGPAAMPRLTTSHNS
jgi:hypothetical protein